MRRSARPPAVVACGALAFAAAGVGAATGSAVGTGSAKWVLGLVLDCARRTRYSFAVEGEQKAKIMASLARADLESLLHTKKLGRTLTRGLPTLRADLDQASTGHASLDASLQGGIPRGHVSELVGPRSS